LREKGTGVVTVANESSWVPVVQSPASQSVALWAAVITLLCTALNDCPQVVDDTIMSSLDVDTVVTRLNQASADLQDAQHRHVQRAYQASRRLGRIPDVG